MVLRKSLRFNTLLQFLFRIFKNSFHDLMLSFLINLYAIPLENLIPKTTELVTR